MSTPTEPVQKHADAGSLEPTMAILDRQDSRGTIHVVIDYCLRQMGSGHWLPVKTWGGD